MFSEREAKLVGTSDFVVTRGYVQIRVVGFPWETASLEAVVRCQDGALLLRRERAEARLWVYRWWRPTCVELVTDTRFERVTFVRRHAALAEHRCSCNGCYDAGTTHSHGALKGTPAPSRGFSKQGTRTGSPANPRSQSRASRRRPVSSHTKSRPSDARARRPRRERRVRARFPQLISLTI